MANDRNLTVRFLADTGDLSKGADEVTGRLQTVATGLKGIAAAGAAVAAVDFFKNAISKASDLGETVSKVGVIFGKEAAAQIAKFGQTADTALGQSKQQAMDAAATFGIFGKSAGLSGEKLAGFSTKMTTLASDMASFSNTTPDEAIEAIGAALRGESEPIMRYGVLLDAATLSQRAFAMGLVATTKDALTPQQRVLAAQAEILAQTSDAQGDFARTSNGLANQQRIAAAQWDNLTAKIGERFLPAVTSVIRMFNDNLIPVSDKVGDTLGDIGSTLAPVASSLGSFASGVGQWFASLPGPLQAGALAFVAWRLAGTQAAGGIGDAFGAVRDKVSLAATGVAVAALDVSKAYTDGAARSREWATEQEHLAVVSGPVAGTLRGAAGEAKGFVSAVGGMTAAVGTTLRSAASGVVGLFGGPWGLALTAATVGLGYFMSSSAKAAEKQKALAEAGKDVAKALADQNGAINASTRSAAAKAAEDAGLLKMAQNLKIPLTEVTSAILGQGSSYDLLKGKLLLVAAAHKSVALTQGEGGYVDVYDKEGQAALDLQLVLDGLVGGKNADLEKTKRQAEAAGEAAGAIDKQSAATGGLTSSSGLLQGAMEGLGLKYDDAKSSGAQLIDVIKGMTEAQITSIDTEEAYEASLDKLTESINTNGTSLDIHTEKGRSNRDALEDAASKVRDMTLADIESGVPMEEAIRRHDERTAALTEEARRSGLNKDEADKLIDTYSKIPANVRTIIEAQNAEKIYKQLLDMNVAQLALRQGIRVDQVAGFTGTGLQSRATGGPIHGPGSKTSDDVLMWGSAGEFMQRAAAVDYYGVDIMHAINNKQIPKQALLPGYADGGLVDWPVNVDTSQTKIPQFAEDVIATGGGGAGTQQWASLVLQVLAMLGQSASLLPNVLRRMNQESGGNPRAINNWDSNAAAGIPSKGLMQTIDPTFNAYAGPFASRGIWDPLANIYAGLNYAIHRYPSLQSAMDRPGGYRNGGWLMPGQLAYNETSTPEPVLNQGQWNALANGQGEVHVHVHANVIGSQRELENWLTSGLDNLKRKGRLPK